MMYREVNSSPRMGSQRHHSLMDGKEMLGSMQLGSQGEGSLVHPVMPSELHKTLARSGRMTLSSKRRGQQLAIDVAFHSSNNLPKEKKKEKKKFLTRQEFT